MRVLVISDVHGNINALNAVLFAAGETDEIWCLGDTVGYGPDPNECVEKLRGLLNLTCLLGNHDAAVLGVLDQEAFNYEASLAIQWTRDRLTRENLEFLETLEPMLIRENVTLVHGSPRNPLWEYILDPRTVRLNLRELTTPFCFHGHSHYPSYFHTDQSFQAEWRVLSDGERVTLTPISFLNPGSIGQPRDKDARASAAIYDSVEQSWLLLKVKYDYTDVQERILAAGLPAKHALRLADGW